MPKINEKAEPRKNKEGDVNTNSENRGILLTTPAIPNICLNKNEAEAAKTSDNYINMPSKIIRRQTPDEANNINPKQNVKSQSTKNTEDSPHQAIYNEI